MRCLNNDAFFYKGDAEFYLKVNCMIALIEAHRTGLLEKKHWISNVVSGVIVGVVALPLAMAFAIAIGVKPEQGLYTAIVASIVVSVFGGTMVQIAGPTGAFIAILAGVIAKYGFDGLQVATLMAGLILVLMGVTGLGSMIKFVPETVILGFTSGIAVVIWVGQWQSFFGLPAVSGDYFHQKLWHLLEVFPQWNLSTTALALLALLLVIYSSSLPGVKRIPGPFVALVVVTFLQIVFQFEGVATIGTAFGGIPQGLPTLQWPQITSGRVVELIQPAFAIAMLGAIESLLSAVVADGMMNSRHDSNQELIGQGLANIVAPLLGGFAATGALARTATNIRHGGNNPLAGIIHAVTLILIILLFASYAIYIPLSVLAAILFVVAWNMGEARHVMMMLRRGPRADALILFVTFFLTVFVNLITAVSLGVVLAAVCARFQVLRVNG